MGRHLAVVFQVIDQHIDIAAAALDDGSKIRSLRDAHADA